MSDWIGLIIILLLIVFGIIGVAWISKPYEVTAEEFERRAREEPGLLNAGVMGLQKILEPGVEKAVEVQEDFRQGFYDAEQEVGDGNDTAPASETSDSSDKKEERDA